MVFRPELGRNGSRLSAIRRPARFSPRQSNCWKNSCWKAFTANGKASRVEPSEATAPPFGFCRMRSMTQLLSKAAEAQFRPKSRNGRLPFTRLSASAFMKLASPTDMLKK